MILRGRYIKIPNSHRGDIDVGLLMDVLRKAGISESEWESVK